MTARLTFALLTTVCAIALATAPGAAAATASATDSVSSNWSGYVVKGPATSTRFSKVSGSWVQPSIAGRTGDAYAVFWVGLGGSDGSSNALEQVGTEADHVGGTVRYYAWYELVPAGPVKFLLTIHPGDKIYAQVVVSGTTVTVVIGDQTTGQWATQTTQMSHPDTSSAEWIAEAPSSCSGSGNCRPLALADFGTVTFNRASATTTTGHAGSISDPTWTREAVRLHQTLSEGAAEGPGFISLQVSAGGAEPSEVSPDGTSFSVSWSGATAPAPPAGGPAVAGGYGSPGAPPGY